MTRAKREAAELKVGTLVRELAATIATQADAIAEGRVIGPVHAAVARLTHNVDTLRAWTTDDRSGGCEQAARQAPMLPPETAVSS